MSMFIMNGLAALGVGALGFSATETVLSQNFSSIFAELNRKIVQNSMNDKIIVDFES